MPEPEGFPRHARKHGGAKRRQWRKIHLGIDEQTLEIRATEITGISVEDVPMLPELLARIRARVEIGSVPADGARPTRRCDEAVAARGAHAAIPPRQNARLWMPSPGRGPPPLDISRPRHLTKVERIPPPKPRRDEDALREAARAEWHGT